ncbi:9b747d40-1608-40c8-8fc4-853bcc32adb3-CDS [Sclerotinia trifoliorum]|uniref:9b747d40-1608-40c8-8fc4-853bcc32adb3-CDS n=1 Tax=Sclerotinia trifoliorum TaxID=28548 RepID=A0A8H2ZV20_9HELO|nr:9b747d40-1608-40c8-8fc4-853bcc32adb3-CDS [Sclerotinia trifoliorum]
MDFNISASEDSHKEREPKIREWQEKTKNEKQPRFKMEKQFKKRQPAGKRKIVTHFVDELSDPRSDDEISDDDWKLELKIKIEPGDVVPWSATSSRSFSDPTVVNPNSTTQATGTKPSGNGGLFQGYNASALAATDTYHPTTPNSRFNFNPPATGMHTSYMNMNMASKPAKRNPSNSTYTDQAINLGSPKLKPKTRAQALAHSDHEMQTSIAKFAGLSPYPTMHSPIDVHRSFSAGRMSTSFEVSNVDLDAETDNPPPYSAQALSILPECNSAMDTSTTANANANTDTKSLNRPWPSASPCISDISSASGYIGYNSTCGENQGVFGNYASGESDERERKKIRAESRDETEDGKQMVHDMDNAENDVKMSEE